MDSVKMDCVWMIPGIGKNNPNPVTFHASKRWPGDPIIVRPCCEKYTWRYFYFHVRRDDLEFTERPAVFHLRRNTIVKIIQDVGGIKTVSHMINFSNGTQ